MGYKTSRLHFTELDIIRGYHHIYNVDVSNLSKFEEKVSRRRQNGRQNCYFLSIAIWSINIGLSYGNRSQHAVVYGCSYDGKKLTVKWSGQGFVHLKPNLKNP